MSLQCRSDRYIDHNVLRFVGGVLVEPVMGSLVSSGSSSQYERIALTEPLNVEQWVAVAVRYHNICRHGNAAANRYDDPQ